MSLEIAPLDRARISVPISLPYYVSIWHRFFLRQAYSEILVANRRFSPTPLLFGALIVVGVTRSEFCRDLWHQKTRILGHCTAFFFNCLRLSTFNHRYGTMPTCGRQTNRLTDGLTHDDSIHSVSIASRGKNDRQHDPTVWMRVSRLYTILCDSTNYCSMFYEPEVTSLPRDAVYARHRLSVCPSAKFHRGHPQLGRQIDVGVDSTRRFSINIAL